MRSRSNNEIHQVNASSQMICQHFGGNRHSVRDADRDTPAKVAALVLCRFAVEVRSVTAPVALDPACENRRVRPGLENMPDALPEAAEGLVLGSPQVAFGEDDNTFASIQCSDCRLNLGRFES